MGKVLYYVHDPMCSWCWGFRRVWEEVEAQLPNNIDIRYLLGGLAKDSHEPMTQGMISSIRDNWYRIEQHIPGTQFNYDFWTQCEPRRSTYPACRAVIAAKVQDAQAERAMILAIQQAYYLHVKNPSNDDVLIECAQQIGLNTAAFSEALNAPTTYQQLLADIKFSRGLGVNSFPSVVLEQAGQLRVLTYDYNDASVLINQLR